MPRRVHRDDLPPLRRNAGALWHMADAFAAATFLMLAAPIDIYLKAMMGEPTDDHIYRDC